MYNELLLVDARNFCFRHGFTKQNLQSGNRPTGVLYGALSGLIRLNRFFPGASIVFCWDGTNTHESWRNKLATNYKGNRMHAKGEVPKEVQAIRQQIPIVMGFLMKMGFRNYAVPRLEADDLIGILATALKDKYDRVTIFSMDKDFYQLIKGNIQVVRDLDKKVDCQPVTLKEIRKRWGVLPKQWLHYRSLVGEKTDNIDKPIAGVGPKTAIKMLKAGVDPSSDTPHPDYKKHWSKIRLCYRLTKIVRKVIDKRVLEISQQQLRIILKEATTQDLHRKKGSRSKKVYNYMMRFLAEYELSELIERRDKLWRIP
jgi:5'-3' exonuclease